MYMDLLLKIIFIDNCTHQKISIGHAALEERKQQRKQRERRENEDEARILVPAKVPTEVPWEGLACETGKDRVHRIRET